MNRLDTPTRLTDLVDYQSGSVVSQTLVKTAGGTVTVFAFDRGEGLSEHSAPFDALVVAVDGAAVMTVGGVEHALGEGQILRLPAGVPHALRATERFQMLLVMVRDG